MCKVSARYFQIRRYSFVSRFNRFCSFAHEREPGAERELGSGRQGRHGDDAEQDRARGTALPALLRGARRHGMLNRRSVLHLFFKQRCLSVTRNFV